MSNSAFGIRSTIRRVGRSYTVLIVVALLIGVVLAPTAYSAAKEYGESTNEIAVIEVGSVIAQPTAEPVEAALQDARQSDSVEAVVLQVNTPGGGLSATESLALEVERTAEEMPVVTSVSQIAASGGYYVSAPTDHIVANPSALVGSVGINFAYTDTPSSGSAIQSGPDKSGGFTEEEAIEMADVMVQGFYGTVLENRGDALELTKQELAYAKVYPSQKAVHNGMIDEVGTLDTALQRAAERADIDRYEVIEPDTTPDLGGIALVQALGDGQADDAQADRVRAMVDPAPGVATPVPLALYGTIPNEQVVASTAGEAPASGVSGQADGSEVSADD
jgi:protease-4